uniref:XRN2-binding (XTBD) domain-containing protein n=1 Tax=Parastrongyloides trichosuri TaxID=131310 RepID=A0A0N4Z231_PARTI
MSEVPNWISKCRLRYETETEWMLREAFLMRNYNDYEKSKLIMLSKVFVNHYMMGCQYDYKIIEKVKEMALGISLERLRSEKRTLTNLTAANKKKYTGKKIKGGVPDLPRSSDTSSTEIAVSPKRKKSRFDPEIEIQPMGVVKKMEEEVLKDELLLFRNKYTLKDVMGNPENILCSFCEDIGRKFFYDVDSNYISKIIIGRILIFSHNFYFDSDVSSQASYISCNSLINGNLEVVKSNDENPFYDYILLSDNDRPENAYFRYISSFLSSLPHQSIPEDGELKRHVETMAQESGLNFYVDKHSEGGWAMDITLRIGELVVGMKHLNKDENKQADKHINNLIIAFLNKLNNEDEGSKLEIELNEEGILFLKY